MLLSLYKVLHLTCDRVNFGVSLLNFPSRYKAFASKLWGATFQCSRRFTAFLLPMSAGDITPYKRALTVAHIGRMGKNMETTLEGV